MTDTTFSITGAERMNSDDNLSLELPEHSEKILGNFGLDMITATQQMSSHIHTYLKTGEREIMHQNSEFTEIGKMRDAYNHIAAWNRISSALGRSNISGSEYWGFISHVNVFRKIFTVGRVLSSTSMDGFATPTLVHLIRNNASTALKALEAEFAEPLYQQILEQRDKNGNSLYFGRFLDRI